MPMTPRAIPPHVRQMLRCRSGLATAALDHVPFKGNADLAGAQLGARAVTSNRCLGIAAKS